MGTRFSFVRIPLGIIPETSVQQSSSRQQQECDFIISFLFSFRQTTEGLGSEGQNRSTSIKHGEDRIVDLTFTCNDGYNFNLSAEESSGVRGVHE